MLAGRFLECQFEIRANVAQQVGAVSAFAVAVTAGHVSTFASIRWVGDRQQRLDSFVCLPSDLCLLGPYLRRDERRGHFSKVCRQCGFDLSRRPLAAEMRRDKFVSYSIDPSATLMSSSS